MKRETGGNVAARWEEGRLPLPLMTSEPGSFAQRALQARKPQIARQVLADNSYPPEIAGAVEALVEELATRPMQPLAEDAPDVGFWNAELACTWPGRSWLDAGWYFAETFFYRRLLEAVRYLQPGRWQGHDPFGVQKRAQERATLAWVANSWDQPALDTLEIAFEVLLHSCLWGNRADLSNVTINSQAYSGLAVRDERSNVLIDDTERVRALIGGGLRRVDFVNDNVGMDLLFDLALADSLLVRGWAEQVAYHLKERPFFVSDAMAVDVVAMVELLRTAENKAARALGARLAEAVRVGRLALRTGSAADGFFWTSCLGFRRLPPELRDDLAQADLVILKGDVNYRRLLDDRHWPHTTRIEGVAGYFPASCLVLRTLKGELIVGLAEGQSEALSAVDPEWLTNGKRGIIQLVIKGAQGDSLPRQ